VHKLGVAPSRQNTDHQTIDKDVMRAFIAHAQTFKPTIPHDLHNYIVAKYVEKRKQQDDID
jgi:DNA replicative helicase MCM subunit Mcm2 (Cdc46/Mcm family)